MKIIRVKEFKSFNEGKNEIIDLLPYNNPLYYYMATITNQEDHMTFTKGDVWLKMNITNENTYKFIITFTSSVYLDTQVRFTYADWKLEECIGVSDELKYKILNALV